jgi:magnesium-protoporphyrin O-methyltransferase
MITTSYERRRGQLQNYFDRTAADAWARLTSTEPVSRIRTTVRAGRDAMRETMLRFLPEDLSGRRILDAGCGTGALSLACAARGAEVVAIDLSATLVKLARERIPDKLDVGHIEFRVGDMCDPNLGSFDHTVCMDSLIHYSARDLEPILAGFARRTRETLVFTFAPRTPALAAMHAVGRLFPRKDRAPTIVPIMERTLRDHFANASHLRAWRVDRSQMISSGFYKSQAIELARR